MNDPYVSRSSSGAYFARSKAPSPTEAALAFGVQLPPWMEDALCAQTDPEAFFPEKGCSSADAKKTCAVCPVRLQCLAYAVENGERYGVWGGLSERERRSLQSPSVPRLSHDEWTREEVRRLTDAGYVPRVIAEQLGCHTDTIRRIKRELGYPPARIGRAPANAQESS